MERLLTLFAKKDVLLVALKIAKGKKGIGSKCKA